MLDWWIWFLISFGFIFCLLSMGGAARRRRIIRQRCHQQHCGDSHRQAEVYVVRMDCHHEGATVYPTATAPSYPQPPIPPREYPVGPTAPYQPGFDGTNPGFNPYSVPPPNYETTPQRQ